MGEPLIQLCQDAQNELGLPVSSAIMGAPDNTSRQFGALANRVGRLLMRMHDWTFLTGLWNIVMPPSITAQGSLTAGSTTILNLPSGVFGSLLPSQMLVSVAGGTPGSPGGLMTATRLVSINAAGLSVTVDQPASVTQSVPLLFSQDAFPLPQDFERPINRTQWDRSMRWELRGPQSPQSDQWIRSGIVAIGPRRQYRQLDGNWRIWPVPYSGAGPGTGSGPGVGGGVLVTEYVSNFWVTQASGTGAIRFTADQDTCVFGDDVMITGLKYLFWRQKGFDFTELETDWMRVSREAIAADGPSPTLDMDRNRFPIFISPSNVQDADFPGSFGNR